MTNKHDSIFWPQLHSQEKLTGTGSHNKHSISYQLDHYGSWACADSWLVITDSTL